MSHVTSYLCVQYVFSNYRVVYFFCLYKMLNDFLVVFLWSVLPVSGRRNKITVEIKLSVNDRLVKTNPKSKEKTFSS